MSQDRGNDPFQRHKRFVGTIVAGLFVVCTV